jgi:hypothetical protein
MEMSGNCYEPVVDFRFTSFDGAWGDGYITSAGLYDVATWPSAGVGFGWRGGSFYQGINDLRVSYRLYMGRSDYTSRNLYVGGRGAR